jgi:hypothetical protein
VQRASLVLTPDSAAIRQRSRVVLGAAHATGAPAARGIRQNSDPRD